MIVYFNNNKINNGIFNIFLKSNIKIKANFCPYYYSLKLVIYWNIPLLYQFMNCFPIFFFCSIYND